MYVTPSRPLSDTAGPFYINPRNSLMVMHNVQVTYSYIQGLIFTFTNIFSLLWSDQYKFGYTTAHWSQESGSTAFQNHLFIFCYQWTPKQIVRNTREVSRQASRGSRKNVIYFCVIMSSRQVRIAGRDHSD
jgi:hypothetical protein